MEAKQSKIRQAAFDSLAHAHVRHTNRTAARQVPCRLSSFRVQARKAYAYSSGETEMVLPSQRLSRKSATKTSFKISYPFSHLAGEFCEISRQKLPNYLSSPPEPTTLCTLNTLLRNGGPGWMDFHVKYYQALGYLVSYVDESGRKLHRHP